MVRLFRRNEGTLNNRDTPALSSNGIHRRFDPCRGRGSQPADTERNGRAGNGRRHDRGRDLAATAGPCWTAARLPLIDKPDPHLISHGHANDRVVSEDDIWWFDLPSTPHICGSSRTPLFLPDSARWRLLGSGIATGSRARNRRDLCDGCIVLRADGRLSMASGTPTGSLDEC